MLAIVVIFAMPMIPANISQVIHPNLHKKNIYEDISILLIDDKIDKKSQNLNMDIRSIRNISLKEIKEHDVILLSVDSTNNTKQLLHLKNLLKNDIMNGKFFAVFTETPIEREEKKVGTERYMVNGVLVEEDFIEVTDKWLPIHYKVANIFRELTDIPSPYEKACLIGVYYMDKEKHAFFAYDGEKDILKEAIKKISERLSTIHTTNKADIQGTLY